MLEQDILAGLNSSQEQAVISKAKAILVLAGAGSGKTRVLIHRIAWLIEQNIAHEQNILAVTFTNKASHEMKQRASAILKVDLSQLWLGTFHGICHRMLRLHYENAGLKKNFQIIDSDDQLKIIKNIIMDLGFNPEFIEPKAVAHFINQAKDQALRPKDTKHRFSHRPDEFHDIYNRYQDHCDTAQVIDFGEIILRVYELLKNNDSIRDFYHKKFKHVLIDEFQDTNHIQYEWVKLISGREATTFVVGDDDQSIYAWRGAKSDNLMQFKKEYKEPELIKLEQNYRSSNIILQAANAIISNNLDRLGKNLWSEKPEGEPIQLFDADSDTQEAQYAIETIKNLQNKGEANKEIAILYRSNAQSRLFEERLIFENIPYKIYGGFKFFDRAEIKDVLAYLRLINNKSDDQALIRIINYPARGIGKKALESIRDIAQEQSISLWDACLSIVQNQNTRSSLSLKKFVELISNLENDIDSTELPDKIKATISATGIQQALEAKQEFSKVENLFELVSASENFRIDYEDIDIDQLDAFLSYAALDNGDPEDNDNAINLMTIHSAKGLEFNNVIVVGMEEGLFPHQRSVQELNGLEEERRLCYVAITRARERLFLSYARNRRIFGSFISCIPSRFLNELPIKDKENFISLSQSYNKPSSSTNTAKNYIGKQVMHKKFGLGIVLTAEGDDEHARVQVQFAEKGVKWLVLLYANLEIVN